MNGGIADDPLARSLLRHLATERGADDPLGSFAHTVLDGEMSLREAADNPWHSQGLAAAVQKAQTALDRMSLSERAEIERTARQLAGRTPEKTRLPGRPTVSPVKRWRIAIPLIVLSALPFAATLLALLGSGQQRPAGADRLRP
jgi:hypothetical protein